MMELPHNERERLLALQSYDVLDTLPESAFDDLTQLASLICGTPVSLVTLVDKDRQWFKSRLGFGMQETPREQSFCSHALLEPGEVMVVPDASRDERFAGNPLVWGDANIRFYAGAPLVTAGGQALGALCVIDSKPRELGEEQRKALQTLARQTMAQLELRRQCVEIVNNLAWRTQMEASLRESEERFRAFMDNSPMLASLKDEGGCYVYVNKPFLDLSSLTPDQVIGHDYTDLWPDLAAHLLERDRAVLSSGQTTSEVESITMPDGSQMFWQAYRFAVQKGGGSGRYVAAVLIDITENKRYEQQLEAYQDKLQEALVRAEEERRLDSATGLHNRLAFDRRVLEEADRAQRQGSQLSLLVLGVDGFKKYNDAFGLGAGDERLREVARLIQGAAREGDFVARYGGDQFAVILPATGVQGAFVLGERFRRAIQDAAWSQRPATVSVGAATLAGASCDAVSLLRAAEEALAQAKALGPNKVALSKDAA